MPAVSEEPSTFFRLSQQTRRRLRHAPPGLLLFFAAFALMSISQGVQDSMYNNYLNDTFHISAETRGQLEFPRELPGLLVVGMTGALASISDVGLGAVAAALVALGMAAVGTWNRRWWPMVASTFLWSSGAHILQPVGDAVSLDLATTGRAGRRLGQVGMVTTFASLGGYALVWVGTRLPGTHYAGIFWIGAVSSAVAIIFWQLMPRLRHKEDRLRFLLKRRYRLFYALQFLFGARKQVFITFGPWVLVKIFGQKAFVLAQLQALGAVLSLFFKPFLGHLIDRVGERVILVTDAVLLMLVTLGYGFAERLLGHEGGLWLVFACFVADQLLFGVSMARTTYLYKIAESPEDITPTLSMGVSMNHLVSMTLPTLGGYAWERWGYEWVFMGAAMVAVLTIFVAARVRTGRPAR
jgi:MFS family permease